MTIEEAIQTIDRLKPNQYDHEQKAKWLSKLDGMIYREVLLTHVGCHIKCFKGYDSADPDTELLVPSPYDDNVYINFLASKIDQENGETPKYNQSIALYNNGYKAFCDWYNRTHLPLPARSQFRI